MDGGFLIWSLVGHWTGQTTEVHVGCSGGLIPLFQQRFLANEGVRTRSCVLPVESFLPAARRPFLRRLRRLG